MSAVWSGMWQEGGIAVNEGSGGNNSTWLEITIWRRKHTQRHSCEGAWAGWPRRQKWQNISEGKVTDRKRICIRQDPIVEERQKSSDGPGWPAPSVTHSQRPGETDRYTRISAPRSCSLTHKLPCPLHLWHPAPCQLFISWPASLAAPPRLFCSLSGVHKRKSTQTIALCLDTLTQTVAPENSVTPLTSN